MTFFGLKDYDHKQNPVNTGKRGSDKIASAERKWVLLSWRDFRHSKPFHSNPVAKNKHVICWPRLVRIGKNTRLLAQFFPIRTSRAANNIYKSNSFLV